MQPKAEEFYNICICELHFNIPLESIKPSMLNSNWSLFEIC